MAVRIVTDSTADLPLKFAHDLGISVVPLSVIFGDEVFREGVDIGHDLFYDKLVHARDLPTTSAPSVGDFLEVYEPLLKETNEIFSVHLSSKLSATYNNACQAANILADRGARIEVIDSQAISLGLTFVTLAAARAAREGGDIEQIRAAVERTVRNIRIYVMVDTLEYLRRGGRIGRARAFLGTMLRVKPLLSLRDGEVHPEERVRTKARAMERLFQIATSFPNVREMAIGYSTNPQDAHDFELRLAAAMPQVNILVTRVGPVIGTHVGPGALAFGLLEGEE
ncbi:MAG: DegV family protein [Chloroflexi bacterium]|nr:DegV family protein [Chloroflexota bacterium]